VSFTGHGFFVRVSVGGFVGFVSDYGAFYVGVTRCTLRGFGGFGGGFVASEGPRGV
jgi:hypothetical protein